MNKFLVIVYPPSPATRGPQLQSANYGNERAPKVQWVTARSPQAAAESVGVQPGGYALVSPQADVCRFERPKQAELEEKRPDGNPLILGAEAAA